MISRLIKMLGIYKHDYKQKSEGQPWNARSAYYCCTKCGDSLYIPGDFVEQMRHSRGCIRRKGGVHVSEKKIKAMVYLQHEETGRTYKKEVEVTIPERYFAYNVKLGEAHEPKKEA